MRLTASLLTQLTPEIQHDISKLSLPVASSAIPAWLEDTEQVWIATFNAKTIALAVLQKSNEDYTLDYFSVREVTRRRGVGSYLLKQISRQLPENAQLIEAQSERLEGEALTIWQQFLASCDCQQTAAGKWLLA